MADLLLTLDQVCEELQMSREQVIALVKSGALRAFLDQKTYKFRRSDIDAYKKKAESSATVVYQGPKVEDEDASDSDVTEPQIPPGEAKEDTSKIDLADIEAEPGADESDQTSVLAPAEESKDQPAEEKPEFRFSDEELGLALEDESDIDVSDQTSLMPAAEEGEEVKEEKPEFAFDKDLGLEEGQGESVLVADESESSVDILEVADESSTDTGPSDTDLAVLEESSSSAEVAAVAEVEESSEEPVQAVSEADKGTETVTDILGETEEVSDEALETLDLDEVLETQETVAEEAPVAEAPTTETVPLAEEAETTGIAEEEATKVVEEAAPEGLEGLEEAAEEEVVPVEEERPEEEAVPAGWELVVPSKLGNAFLMAAILMLAVGGMFIFCEMAGIRNGLTDFVVEAVKSYLPG